MSSNSAAEVMKRRERVESMLLMGFTPAKIREAINTPERTISRDIAEIRKAWAEEGAKAPDREARREEMLRKARLAESRAWQAFTGANGASEKSGALRTILTAQERQAKLQGLDVPVQEGLISMSTLNRVLEQHAVEVEAAVREVIQDEVLRTQILDLIEARWGTIQVEPGKPGRGGAA